MANLSVSPALDCFLDIQVPAIVTAFVLSYEVKVEWSVDIMRSKLTLEVYNKVTGRTDIHLFRNTGRSFDFERFVAEIAKSGDYRSKHDSKVYAELENRNRRNKIAYSAKRKAELGIRKRRR